MTVPQVPWRGSVWPWLALVLAGGLGLRVLGLDGRWLWFDELLSVNFSHHGLFETLVTAARFDVHPPLYYLQLSVWMRFGQGDAFVALNSVAWSLVSIVFVAAAAARLAGPSTAIVAASLFGAWPAAVLYAQEVRMYALVMAGLAIAFWAWLRVLERGRATDLLLAVGAVLAVVYSHAVGFVMAAGVCAYPMVRLLVEGARDRAKTLALGYGLIVVGSLPAIAFSGSRGVLHTLAPTPHEIATTLHEILFGWDNWLASASLAAAGALAFGLAALCLWSRSARLVFGCTVVLPIAAVIAISYAVTPIWLTRTIVVFVPFMALSLALAIFDLSAGAARRAGFTGGALAGLLAIVAVQQQLNHRNGDDFRLAADFVRANAHAGDAVFANLGPYETWALLWYLGGPNWGTPLSFHDVNPAWQRMLARLGESWVRRLGLRPDRDVVTVGSLQVTSQFARALGSLDASRVFVVRRLETAEGVAPGRRISERQSFRQMGVELWSRP